MPKTVLQIKAEQTRRFRRGVMQSAESGFSLTEMLVVITVIGLMAGITIPAFVHWLRAYKVRTTSDQLQGEMRLARNVAVAINASVPILVKETEFSWTDANGRVRRFVMPEGVSVTNLTDAINGDTVSFLNNGQFSAPSKTFTVDGWVYDTVHHIWTVSFTASGKVAVVRTSP